MPSLFGICQSRGSMLTDNLGTSFCAAPYSFPLLCPSGFDYLCAIMLLVPVADHYQSVC